MADFEFRTYSQSVTVRKEDLEPVYRKREWVPVWIWNLVAIPNVLYKMSEKFKEENRRSKEYFERLLNG